MKRALATFAALATITTLPARAELDGPRVYLPLPQNTNVVSATWVGGTANASLSVLNRVEASMDIETDLYLLGYTRSQPLFDRTIHWQLLIPAGSLNTNSPLPIGAANSYADGFGDISFGATVNVLGAPALPVREALRHEVDFSLGFGVLVTAPTGAYDSMEVLNMGSNQWSVRLSAPMIYSLDDWVPGRITTLEIMPSVRLFSDNDDSFGETVSQDPMFAVEAHLTRDLTKDAFISLDYTWLGGGDRTFTDNATGTFSGSRDGINAQILGATLGYTISDHFRLYASHMQTIAESSNPVELKGSLTKIQLVWSWHDVLEKRQDFLE